MPKKKATKKIVKKSTRASGKKSKLDSMTQVHGKAERVAPTTLDQIWGDDGIWKYNTMKVDEYRAQLNEYNLTDLQRHASKVGIIPIESRVRLQETLMREFKKHVSTYNVPNDPPQTENISEEAMKILKEGR